MNYFSQNIHLSFSKLYKGKAVHVYLYYNHHLLFTDKALHHNYKQANSQHGS